MAYQLFHLHYHPYSAQTLVCPKPFGSSHDRTSFPVLGSRNRKTYKTSHVHNNPRNIKAVANPNDERSTNVKVVVNSLSDENSPTNNAPVTTPSNERSNTTTGPNNHNSTIAKAVVTDPIEVVTSPSSNESPTVAGTSDHHSPATQEAIIADPTDESSTVATTTRRELMSRRPNKSTIKAVVTVQKNENLTGIFNFPELQLEIVAAELDPRTGVEKETIKKIASKKKEDENEVKFETEIEVPLDFGEIGAVIVENEQKEEMYIKKIALGDRLTITCNSWVHSKYDNPVNRIFFTNKSYLPSQTPSGIKRRRENELRILRGYGEGERKKFERIYDYDVYNDLGNPDAEDDLSRPVLGGKEFAYPRRCRTGRPRCNKDPLSESNPKGDGGIYVPRDEQFSEVKSSSFRAEKIFAIAHAYLPLLSSNLKDHDFPYFTEIDKLFDEGLNVKVKSGLVSQKKFKSGLNFWDILSELINLIKHLDEFHLRFDVTRLMARDKFSWLRDEEFCRQTLAGVNPCSIQLVKEWPLRSTLDPKVYGPPESAITKEMVEQQIKGVMTLEEAIEQKRLFMLDYHDLLLPYVNKVRELKGTTLYGSRTLMFLNPTEELMPIAIELTRPPTNKKPQWKQVFMPNLDATGAWLWRLAKAHVLAHDSGYHQLVSHWLRTHCVTEPYIIASNRQLSAMHPIYRLLHPYFRYTLELNAEARNSLINANGIIETGFSLGKYCMELSSVAYDQWRFDLQALPADLISRGMAVKDPTSPHGLKLSIEDYPFASDGLILWDAIKEWVTNYVNYYYPNASLVESDQELKAWWEEIRTVGHGDKKDEPWWPVLKTPENLIEILTTIIWVTSGHHSAVNFGQYDFAGYFPNRPSIARTKMPTEDSSDEEWKQFVNKPEQALLACLPSVFQATLVMGILSVLSTHSSDEEYIGQHPEPSWEENQNLKTSFDIFTARLLMLKATIGRRNVDTKLKNRTGAGLVPYEFFIPVSEKGITGRGVPNSISI